MADDEFQEYSLVAFLDILGYREMLKADVGSNETRFRERLTRSFRMFEEMNTATYKYEAISDSIFISCSERGRAPQFVQLLRRLFLAFLEESLLVRGGISYGRHFRSNSITYSPALAKAYDLESRVADVPRIVVDDNIVDMFPTLEHDCEVLRSGRSWFVNPAPPDVWSRVWAAATSSARESLPMIRSSQRVHIKHFWLQELLVELAKQHRLPKPVRYLRIYDVEAPNAIDLSSRPERDGE
jgi:hypothetical protein